MRAVLTVEYVYSFLELSEQAQRRAVLEVNAKQSALRRNGRDPTRLISAITYEFAIGLGSFDAGWHALVGIGSVPGIRLDGRGLDRPDGIVVQGQLDRGNAPHLPWFDGIHSVSLVPYRSGQTIVDVNDTGEICVCDRSRTLLRRTPAWWLRHSGALRDALRSQGRWPALLTVPPNDEPICPARIGTSNVDVEQRLALQQAVCDVVGSAWEAGRRANALDVITSGGCEFTPNGALYQA